MSFILKKTKLVFLYITINNILKMLPRETTVRQLKKLRAETKGKDIGDLTVNDRLNKNLPNLQYIGNPVDTDIESWEEFSKHDSQLQTIAFKSKLVNKPLVKENKKEIMKDKVNNVLNFQDFEKNWKPEDAKKTKRTEVAKDILKEDIKNIKKFYEDLDEDDIIQDDENIIQDEDDIGWNDKDTIQDDEDENQYDDDNIEEWLGPDPMKWTDEDYEDEFDEDEEPHESNEVQTFESFKLKDVDKKEIKQPEYTILGEEKEPKSNPLFGVAAVKDQENKKIAWFNDFVIDPKTPKERPILNAGQFIHTEKVRGYVNRIEGNKVFVESLDEPTKIIEISLKDAIKPPVQPKEEIKRFDEISKELNKEFLKNK